MLTPHQQRLLQYLRQYIATQGFSPSLQEIASTLGLTASSTVHHHLQILQDHGYITRQAGKKRNITLTKESREVQPNGTPIPLRGRYSPSQPLERIRDQFIYLTTPTTTNYQPLFAVKIKTDIPTDYLFTHDLLIFQDTQKFKDHDILLCHLGNHHLLLKRAQTISKTIQLTPIYTTSTPIETLNLHILGRLLHILRTPTPPHNTLGNNL